MRKRKVLVIFMMFFIIVGTYGSDCDDNDLTGEGPECVEDDDCPVEKPFCLSPELECVECEFNEDCPSLIPICSESNECIEPQCDSDADCSPNFECFNSQCISSPITCEIDEDCPFDSDCEDGFCVDRLTAPPPGSM